MKFVKFPTELSESSKLVKDFMALSGITDAKDAIKSADGFVATTKMPVGAQFKITGVSLETVKNTNHVWGKVECTDIHTGEVYAVSAKNLCAVPATLAGWVTDNSTKLTHQFSAQQGGKAEFKVVTPDCQSLTPTDTLFVPPVRNWLAFMEGLQADLADPDNGELGETVFTYKGTVCREYVPKSPVMIAGDYCEAGWQRVLSQKVFTI